MEAATAPLSRQQLRLTKAVFYSGRAGYCSTTARDKKIIPSLPRLDQIKDLLRSFFLQAVGDGPIRR
jgi:hypothetical protein